MTAFAKFITVMGIIALVVWAMPDLIAWWSGQ